jgi:hypothetical protein
MAKELVKSFDRTEAAMFVVHLAIPKLVAYIRRRRITFGILALVAKMSFIKNCIFTFMDKAENAIIKRAFQATPYASNPTLLAKKLVHVI